MSGVIPRPRSLAGCAALLVAALALGGCGNTLQDQPLGPAPLESVIVKSRFPVYWLGLRFAGLPITGVSIDPGEAVTIHYGDCVLGGQYTCVTPITLVSAPDNDFVPGAAQAATVALRGVQAHVAPGAKTLAIVTGSVVVSVFGHTPALARQAARAMTPLNAVGLPGQTLPAAQPDSGFELMPLPGQVPPGVSTPRLHGA